tara:strand:- start:206 stop:433 length:228 start_codon:yes stop_codon:yes gene_type:complete
MDLTKTGDQVVVVELQVMVVEGLVTHLLQVHFLLKVIMVVELPHLVVEVVEQPLLEEMQPMEVVELEAQEHLIQF